jgi:hypothetical protein
MEYFFVIALIFVILILPVLVRNYFRPPSHSKFGEHEIVNPSHAKTARCTRCRKTYEWKRRAWRQIK